MKKPRCFDPSAAFSGEREAMIWEEAAKEALEPRVMLLTHAQMADGILNDDHPIIRARKQMRQEIHDAFLAKAAARRAGKEGA